MEIYRYDPEALQGASMATMPADEIPYDVWAAFQAIQQADVAERLIEALPESAGQDSRDRALARAVILTNNGDVGAYAQQRGTSKFVVQNGLRDGQSYKDSLGTVVLDHNDTVIGGAVTVHNVHSPLPGLFGRMHCGVAMRIEGRRQVKVMDVIGPPEVAIAGLVGALEARGQRDGVRAYAAPEELPDRDMLLVVGALGMSVGGSNPQEGVPGYPSPLEVYTYAGRVGSALQHVYQVEGIRELMANVQRLDRLPEVVTPRH